VDVVRDWLALGAPLVVVTRGGEGVFAVTAQLELDLPATPIDLVDTVGAGDSFSAGLLDGLGRADLIGGARRDALAAIDEASLTSVLDDASLIASITCSRPGADPPTRAEVETARSARPSPRQSTPG
jgi:fructokinase